jgi:hypothetical protein
MRLFAAVSGMLVFSLAFAAEYPIDIKTDLKGSKFFVVEKSGTPNKPIVVVRRAAGTTSSYTSREFDCKARTVKTLGRGDSLEALNKAEPDKEAFPIKENSIPDQLAKHACPK